MWAKRTLVVGILLLLGLVVGRVHGARIAWDCCGITSFAQVLAPHDAELHFNIGDYFFGNGAYDPEWAYKHFIFARNANPALARVNYQLARLSFLNGNFSDAYASVLREKTIDPSFGKSHYMEGLILGYRAYPGDFEKSVKAFKNFIAYDPLNWAGYNDLSWIYFQKGDYKNAWDVANQGLTQAYGNPWLLNSRGIASLAMNKSHDAEQDFNDALDTIATMTADQWGVAYPGNNPSLYAAGFASMKDSIERNLGRAMVRTRP
ncbi:MAG: tetratricopeptide repeat protein [Patescibacteria group bacterium]